MNRIVLVLALSAGPLAVAAEPTYEKDLQTWRDAREKALRADDGWLTLAGRYPLKAGDTTFGSGRGNDLVLPPEFKGVGPDRLGTLHVDAEEKRVTLRLADGVKMEAGGKAFTGERVFAAESADWVGLGRLRLRVIVRDGGFVLRLADNESAVRKTFPGCRWYAADERFKVAATFVPYPPGKTLRVVNVLGKASQEPCPGYAEFKLGGEMHRLDATAEGGGLFFVFKDRTAGDTTYGAGRFLTVEPAPKDNATFTLDFNKAYNPPCAVSEFTTCPTPPTQNVLPVRVEAGEKFGKK